VTVSLAIKNWFFDRAAVQKAVSRGNLRALAKAGAFLRTRARTSLRRRKKPSAPGQPPSVHSRDSFVTLKNILFGLEPQRQAVLIGPVGLGRAGRSTAVVPDSTVPNVLEFGGQVSVLEEQLTYTDHGAKVTRWIQANPRLRRVRNRDLPQRRRRVRIAPRPFMGPALEAEAAHIPEAWAGTVKG
jgi:hypothetical protein